MAVQRYVQQYQSSKAPGQIAENNPSDIGTFVVGSSGLIYGIFCAIGSKGIQVEQVNASAKIVGVVAKQLDRVSVNRGMSQESAEVQAYEATPGKSVAILRSGYVNVVCETPWELYEDVYVRVSGNGVIGSISTKKSGDNEFFQIIHATFIDDSNVSGIAKIFIDLRIPVQPGQSLSNIWTTS